MSFHEFSWQVFYKKFVKSKRSNYKHWYNVHWTHAWCHFTNFLDKFSKKNSWNDTKRGFNEHYTNVGSLNAPIWRIFQLPNEFWKSSLGTWEMGTIHTVLLTLLDLAHDFCWCFFVSLHLFPCRISRKTSEWTKDRKRHKRISVCFVMCLRHPWTNMGKM